MPLYFQPKSGSLVQIHSAEEFFTHFGVRYLPHLKCIDDKTERAVRKQVAKALKKGRITTRQKWLGTYYAKELAHPGVGDYTVRWVDERLGYGLWTNRKIPALSCIGVYTGILRRRRFWGRWKNHYCFLYEIGDLEKAAYTIDAEIAGNHTRFINHSSSGNLEAASAYSDGLMQILLYAKEEIPEGTQLCYDYGPDYWKKRSKSLLTISAILLFAPFAFGFDPIPWPS